MSLQRHTAFSCLNKTNSSHTSKTKAVCKRMANFLDKEPEKSMSTELLSDLNLKEGAEIHKPCYIRLTNVYKFEQAKKSLEKVSGLLGAGR